MSTETTAGTKPERPRGTCTGCGFEYTLSVARSGEHKGDPVTRKHNSRTGPGLCDGAQKQPREAVAARDDPAAAPGGVQVSVPVDHDNEVTTPAVAPGGVSVFADPAPMPAELPPVSGQLQPDRDRWGRYLIKGQGHTRATSFAKLGSSTFALGEWNERMLVKGLTERPDLLALAHGLDVKQDKKQLNQIADDAQQHAGNKVAANIGTAYHAFTERLDAGLITLADVPEQYRARCEQYVNALRAYGLTTRREWIERTTAVRADQVSAPVPVAGTLDRILQLPNGDLVIGDLKTGSDLSYGWVEIAVQLALYAHGVNTHGLFDWRSKTWSAELGVRTDYAIVMHLPADGDGCTLYRVDLVKGWAYAQVSGAVQSRQKDKSVAGVLVPGSLSVPVPAVPEATQEEMAVPEATQEEMAGAMRVVAATSDPGALAGLYDYAVAAGKFSAAQLDQIKSACRMQWDALNIPY